MTTGKELKIEIGMELATEFERRKTAIYNYIEHVFNGGDPHDKPGGKPWYHNDVMPYAHHIVNVYRETQDIPPNPFPPAYKQPFRAFDKLREWTADGGWMPSSELRKYINNAMVESTFKNYQLDKYGWKMEKKYEGTRPFYKLVRTEDANA